MYLVRQLSGFLKHSHCVKLQARAHQNTPLQRTKKDLALKHIKLVNKNDIRNLKRLLPLCIHTANYEQ